MQLTGTSSIVNISQMYCDLYLFADIMYIDYKLCMQLFSSHSHFCPCCYDYCKRYTFFADLRCCRELYLRRSLCNCSAVDCVLSSFFSRVITNIFEQFLKQIFRLILTKKREFTETSWLSLFIYAGSKLYLHITPLHMFKYYAKHQYI